MKVRAVPIRVLTKIQGARFHKLQGKLVTAQIRGLLVFARILGKLLEILEDFCFHSFFSNKNKTLLENMQLYK